MKNLLTIKEQDINPDSPAIDSSGFSERKAARAVLLDEKGQVYLLSVSKYNFHKLPGGGIDEGEEIIDALKRELLEEVGCRAEVIAELGSVVEYRHYKDGGLKQTSYSYLAKQIGKKMDSVLEQSEIEDGMSEIKAKNIDEAIQLVQNDAPQNMEGVFIKKRDLAILNTAKKVLENE